MVIHERPSQFEGAKAGQVRRRDSAISWFVFVLHGLFRAGSETGAQWFGVWGSSYLGVDLRPPGASAPPAQPCP